MARATVQGFFLYSESRKALAKNMNLADRLTKARAFRAEKYAEKVEADVPVEVPVKATKERAKKENPQ